MHGCQLSGDSRCMAAVLTGCRRLRFAWAGPFFLLFSTIMGVEMLLCLDRAIRGFISVRSAHWLESPDHCTLASEWLWLVMHPKRILMKEPMVQVPSVSSQQKWKYGSYIRIYIHSFKKTSRKVGVYITNIKLHNKNHKVVCSVKKKSQNLML